MEEFLTDAHQRKDLHYHVMVGESEWIPEDPGHPDSLDINIVYDDHIRAHQSFISTIRGFGAAITLEDIKNSAKIWQEIYEEVKVQHVLEVITYLGLGYKDLGIPIELIACNGCVPYGMN
jgi:hypothetical protein